MTNLTATQIAQLTATVTGGGYKRAADKEAAIRRFINACTENGIADPSATIALDFEAAKAAPGKRAAILEAAQRGELPAAPDFTAETHKRFRAKLAEVVAAAEAGDLAALRAFEIKPVSSSPKAIIKYRDLAVIALEARAAKGAAA